jgi:hypothetical protein
MNLPLTAFEIRHRLRAMWQATHARITWPEVEVRRLVEEKYSTEKWLRRR